MSLPTRAQWTDAFLTLTNFKGLGSLYASVAHIFVAFGVPEILTGTVRTRWSDGATADYLGTGAGAAVGTVAPAQVDASFIREFAIITSQSYEDFATLIGGGTNQATDSVTQAVLALYDKFVEGVLGAGTGVDNALWGAENVADEARVITAGMVDEAGGPSGELLDYIDSAIVALPETGYNICLCANAGKVALMRDIRKLGGAAPVDVIEKDFGAPVLTYNACAFLQTRHAASDNTFMFYNIGPEGCQIVVPPTGPFTVQGDKQPEGYMHTAADIALACQILYKSPRAIFKLVQDITKGS